MKIIDNFFTDESGATSIEYGLIAALIALVIIVSLSAVSGLLEENFKIVSGSL